MLQLLDRAGELADLRFETVDPLRKLLTRTLRDASLLLRRALLLALAAATGARRHAIAVAEEVVEESLRRRCARCHGHGGGDRRRGDQPKRDAEHWPRSTVIWRR